MCQCAQWLDAKRPDERYYGILLVLCYIFECIFGIIDVGHLHLVLRPLPIFHIFGNIWHLGLNIGVMLKSGPATAGFLVLKQLFSFFSIKIMPSLCIFNGKSALLECYQAKKIKRGKYCLGAPPGTHA